MPVSPAWNDGNFAQNRTFAEDDPIKNGEWGKPLSILDFTESLDLDRTYPETGSLFQSS
ncbi:hypothetical protein Pla110_38440 [Polystyrenella longa]|uniref:Uncharacterized protein n=1 Tax=Polystyrenella longa TaxID=2528007 RepID=A0A518CS80_9PLAN|nr:hypothetical protein Pla110_38440 [Polystyrenella longa]